MAASSMASPAPGHAQQEGRPLRGQAAAPSRKALVGSAVGLLLALALSRAPGLHEATVGPKEPPEEELLHGDDPQAVLLRQLEQVDSQRQPATARALHAALGQVHRGAGRDEEALRHFEAARDLATHAGGAALASARVALGEGYLKAGRARDALFELGKALGAMGPGHADEFAASHALGRAGRELGHHDAARRALERALERAPSRADRVAVLSDLAEVLQDGGDVEASLARLRDALGALRALESGGMAGGQRARLGAGLQRRAGMACRALGDVPGALAHLGEALKWESDASARAELVERIAELERAAGPSAATVRSSEPEAAPAEREEPRRSHQPAAAASPQPRVESDEPAPIDGKVPTPSDLRDLTIDLMNDWRTSADLRKAETTVVSVLDKYEARGDEAAAATAHNLLGWIRRAEERYPEAGRRYMRALVLALKAGGPDPAGSQEAEIAYQGLSFVQASFHYVGRPKEAAKLFEDAVAAADAAGVPTHSQGRKWGERRLKANAR